MNKETTIVSSRPDRELLKRTILPGNFNIVPYEDSRCRISLSEISCKNEKGPCEIEPESRIFSSNFDGNVLIGDCDNFIDKDFELILQQMCCGESCAATMVYRDGDGVLVNEISCNIELREVTEEQLISEWSRERLHEAALYHKEKGVELVKQNRLIEGFRRFSKALKMLVAVEPLDPATVSEDVVKDMVDLKVKLYNNLAHCQLQYKEFGPALELCNKALSFNPDNAKSLYRRCLAYTGLCMYEEAWNDIQSTLALDPKDKAAQQKASALKPIIEKMNKEYANVVKKMFL